MSRRILYLSFYFEPDLCAGSFRNSPLVHELSKQAVELNTKIDLLTTLPNRYKSFEVGADEFEVIGNLTIRRAQIPKHKSGFFDQIRSFYAYYQFVQKHTKGKQYDLVVASSSRLFTAFLARLLAMHNNCKLYLDIRDIFSDTMKDVSLPKPIKWVLIPMLERIEKFSFKNAAHINLISQGFESYFNKHYTKPNFTYYSHGVDDEFIELGETDTKTATKPYTILYAGNIGEGQGLHEILPAAAAKLGSDYQFVIYGDGGCKQLLEDQIKKLQINNIVINKPIQRKDLLKEYQEADFYFIHLNDYPAFEKVLPSKIFELAAQQKPIIAGVGGYAAQFLQQHVPNLLLFKPCQAEELVSLLNSYTYYKEKRSQFIHTFKRESINVQLAQSMLACLPNQLTNN
jgi:glycosyltransferase involved in cell wall biosynthesis